MRIAARPVHLPHTARSKYRAQPTVVDGIRFASKREAARYGELKLLQKAGKIYGLRCQPVFSLWAYTGVDRPAATIGTYVADFEYLTEDDVGVVEDVKGVRTALYKWKKKHVEAQYGIQIQEIR